jgi:hypothetical protein
MATVSIVYIMQQEKEREYEHEKITLTLCFACAIKEILNKQNVKTTFHLETTYSKNIQCDICESFLNDRITI